MLQRSSQTRSIRRAERHRRLRARVHGTAARPRLSVFRSKKHLFVQIVDDDAARTLCMVHDKLLPKKIDGGEGRSPGVARAFALGTLLAKRARELGITRVVFDRGGHPYHGRVEAVADGARAGGLEL